MVRSRRARHRAESMLTEKMRSLEVDKRRIREFSAKVGRLKAEILGSR